ncbi:MAG: hypothetical protein HN368_02700 [Spirochaetales bacterium]|nr:hypothetical protein [Spirochaetales bacterium]
MEICPSCEDYQKAEDIAETLASAAKRYTNISAKSYNMALSENAEKYAAVLIERELPDISYLSTVLIVNNEYVIGYEEIEIAANHMRKTGEFKVIEGSEK